MAKRKNSDLGYDLQIQNIELLKTSMGVPTNTDMSLQELNFKIGIETKIPAKNKALLVIVSVEVRNDDLRDTLGSVMVSCLYSIENFDQLVKIQPDGKIDMPQALTDTLNLQSIATARGIMFATFKGTFLHQALLPMVDPRSLQIV